MIYDQKILEFRITERILIKLVVGKFHLNFNKSLVIVQLKTGNN
jgi:hypothetical protein